jgi:hypothetical protein
MGVSPVISLAHATSPLDPSIKPYTYVQRGKAAYVASYLDRVAITNFLSPIYGTIICIVLFDLNHALKSFDGMVFSNGLTGKETAEATKQFQSLWTVLVINFAQDTLLHIRI